MTRPSEQLEREAEATRAQVADTLEELRSRISPGQVVDQLVDYAREGGAGDFVRNLGRDLRSNPLPIALIGAGIAWLIAANGKSPRRSSGPDASAEFGDTATGVAGDAAWRARRAAGDFGDDVADAAGRLREGAGSAAGRLSDSARAAGSAIGDAARGASSRVSDAASQAASAAASFGETASSTYRSAAQTATEAAQRVGDTAAAMSRGTVEASRSLIDFAKEQPLVLAGIGLAVGAAIGAALPSTETENRLMGETSDEMKDAAQKLAAEQYEKVKQVAEAAYGEGVKEAEKQGLGETDPHAAPVTGEHEASVVPSGDEAAADRVHGRS